MRSVASLPLYETASNNRLEAGMCGVPGEGRKRRVRFSDQLVLLEAIEGDRIDLGTIARIMGRRSLGALLVVFALPVALPVPMPGIAILFGVPLILISAQLLLRRRRAWLPQRLARQSIGHAEIHVFIEHVLPPLRRLERIVRPRCLWLAGEWTMAPIGAICLILAVIITLPVPLGHMLPGTAVSLLALGMLERDGLIIGIGLATAGIALVLVVGAATGIAAWVLGHSG